MEMLDQKHLLQIVLSSKFPRVRKSAWIKMFPIYSGNLWEVNFVWNSVYSFIFCIFAVDLHGKLNI